MLALALIIPFTAFGGEWGELAERFDHPERYRILFERMADRGIPEERIRALFGSEKALERDNAALKERSDPGEIPDHQQAEREANQRYLDRTKILAEHLREHREVYRAMERRYRIRREVIGAILLKESALGRYGGLDHDAFVVFNTLYDGLEVPDDPGSEMTNRAPRLIRMAREQLIALAVFAFRRDLSLSELRLPASYAGAVGIPQWLPVHLPQAVSAGDDPPDLSHSPDAILSTGNLLRNKLGWPEAMLDFARLANLDEIVAAWRSFDTGRTSFVRNQGPDGQPLRRFDRAHSEIPNVGYVAQYVRGLMGYNNSSDYALGVLQIARRAHQLRTDG